jgi:hypothetical protein
MFGFWPTKVDNNYEIGNGYDLILIFDFRGFLIY